MYIYQYMFLHTVDYRYGAEAIMNLKYMYNSNSQQKLFFTTATLNNHKYGKGIFVCILDFFSFEIM